MKKLISLLCASIILCFCLMGCNEEKKAAIADFETAVQTVEQKNTELDTAISSAENIVAEGKVALDESLVPALETAISEAKATKKTVPEQPKETEEISAATEELNAVDYSEAITNLSEKQSELERSIQRYSLVDNPTEAYIIECLKKVPNIIDISSVTEDNDPNGNLNKTGGYTAQVYFSSDLINQSEIYGTSVIDKGTGCGGSIEVYTTVENATKRNDYLSSFDGGILASGSHTIIGTVLVRTSNELTASQQKAIEANIIAALTDDTESITEALEPVKQTSKTTNE